MLIKYIDTKNIDIDSKLKYIDIDIDYKHDKYGHWRILSEIPILILAPLTDLPFMKKKPCRKKRLMRL